MEAQQTNPVITTKAMNCAEHGDFEAKLLIGKRFTGCPTCAAAEQQARETRIAAERKASEEAATAQRIRVLLQESGLVGRQLRATFDNYEAREERQQAVLADCQAYMAQFVKGVPPPTTSLWLLGTPGTGKSHLGAAMVNQLITQSAVPARIHSGQEIIRMLRATWNRDHPARKPGYENYMGEWVEGAVITEDELLHDLGHCKLLVLDEIGVGHGSNSEHTQLFEVLDMRYKLERPTVLVSNLTASGIKTTLGDRLYDRLREGATIKSCDWKSYRGEFSRRAKQRGTGDPS